jgi:hypothetical protein
LRKRRTFRLNLLLRCEDWTSRQTLQHPPPRRRENPSEVSERPTIRFLTRSRLRCAYWFQQHKATRLKSRDTTSRRQSEHLPAAIATQPSAQDQTTHITSPRSLRTLQSHHTTRHQARVETSASSIHSPPPRTHLPINTRRPRPLTQALHPRHVRATFRTPGRGAETSQRAERAAWVLGEIW